MAEKKAPISLAERNRAAHVMRNMGEKHFDRLIEEANKDGKTDRAKGLEVSRDGCLAAMDALLEMLDVLIEYEDDFLLFYRGICLKQVAVEQAPVAPASGGKGERPQNGGGLRSAAKPKDAA